MLSTSTGSASSSTRRPLPPAKARKSIPLTFAALHPDNGLPAHTLPLQEMILDSPVTVTTHLVNTASKSMDDIGLPGTPGIEDWMNEKSREELSGLLLKADGIIKSRETGALRVSWANLVVLNRM